MAKFISNVFVIIANVLGGALVFLLVVTLFASGIVGTIYWIVEDRALNAVLSVFIPLYGAVTVIMDIVRG